MTETARAILDLSAPKAERRRLDESLWFASISLDLSKNDRVRYHSTMSTLVNQCFTNRFPVSLLTPTYFQLQFRVVDDSADSEKLLAQAVDLVRELFEGAAPQVLDAAIRNSVDTPSGDELLQQLRTR